MNGHANGRALIRRAARRRQRTCLSMALDTSTLIIGALAAIASTGSFAPQAWKIIKTRETKDISTGMYGLTVAGLESPLCSVTVGLYCSLSCNRR